MGGSHSIYKVTFQRTCCSKESGKSTAMPSSSSAAATTPRSTTTGRGGAPKLAPGPSVRLSHSQRLKSLVTFKTDSKGITYWTLSLTHLIVTISIVTKRGDLTLSF